MKALLGNDFQLTKYSSELNPKPVNVISLEAFELLLLRLDRKGNKAAQDLRDQLVGLSLYQLFSDAFGIELQARDRSQWLRDRQDGIKMRRGFTHAIEDYCSRNNVSDNYLKFIYPNASDKLNRLLFGKSAKELCKDYDCPKSALRNQFNSEEILDIRRLEEYAMRLIDRDNVEPLRALETAYAFWKS